MRSWGSLLPYFLYMACDYKNEAMKKFLLPSQPDKGNFTSRTAYETALKTYQHDHTRVMEVREWWKQGEEIKDVCWEAAEWSRKCCHLEEEEAVADMSIKHCKCCALRVSISVGLWLRLEHI